MARATIVLNDFSGGLCDDPDPKDLKDNELVQASGINLSNRGKITTMGSFDPVSWSSPVNEVATLETGYGIFTFSGDYTSTGGMGVTDFIAIAGKTSTNANVVQVFESDKTKWSATDGADEITINVATTKPFYPVFSYIDGVLRITDGNLDSTGSVSKWFGYINRDLFDTTNSIILNRWYTADANLLKPNIVTANTNFVQAQHVTNLSTSTFDNGFVIFTAIPSTLNGDWDNNKVVAFTYIYENGQESIPTIFPITGKIMASSMLTGKFSVRAYVDPSKLISFNPRISGVGVYSVDSTDAAGGYAGFPTNKLYRLATIDFERNNGIKLDVANDSYRGWQDSTLLGTSLSGISEANGFAHTTSFSQLVETYETITGITGNIYIRQEATGEINRKSFINKYKTIALANRIAYTGAVDYKLSTNSSNIYSLDTIIKSFPNRFDVFHPQNKLDVTIGDGDEIISLQQYADRILEFKKRKLYIINIAQDVEFLEAELDFMGIDYPFQVCRTEYGIAWFNNRGAYLYDGNRVIDLFLDSQDNTRRKINLSSWRSFLGTKPAIAYDAQEKILMIIDNLAASACNIRILDMVSMAWTYGSGRLLLGTKTNPITNWNGALTYLASTATGQHSLRTWDRNSTFLYSNHVIQTKFFDFGLPGIKKNIYPIFITHKESGGNINAAFFINDDLDTAKQFSTSAFTSSSSYVSQKFLPNAVSDMRDIKSLQLYFAPSGALPSSFSLTDIQIVYRVKGLR